MERWGRVKSGGGGGALSRLQESPRCPTHPMGKWEARSKAPQLQRGGMENAVFNPTVPQQSY